MPQTWRSRRGGTQPEELRKKHSGVGALQPTHPRCLLHPTTDLAVLLGSPEPLLLIVHL